MSNLSIESQVAELCFATEEKIYVLTDPGDLKTVCNDLSTDIKVAVSQYGGINPECCAAIDQNIKTLFDAGVLNSADLAVKAIRSIVQCVSKNEMRRAARLFLNLDSL